MDLTSILGGKDMAELKARVEAFNRGIRPDRTPQNDLDKDDFLKILMTQLTHQDPTQPLEDKDFVAQMAQFSALEQITNMNSEMSKVFQMLTRGQAVAMLGDTVEIQDGGQTVRGIVRQVTGGDYPQLLVNGRFFDFASVQSVIGATDSEEE